MLKRTLSRAALLVFIAVQILTNSVSGVAYDSINAIMPLLVPVAYADLGNDSWAVGNSGSTLILRYGNWKLAY